MDKVVITGGRGSGKTSELLRIGEELGLFIICNTEHEAGELKFMADSYGYKRVCVGTIQHGSLKNYKGNFVPRNQCGVLIHDIDRWFGDWRDFGGLSIMGYSTGQSSIGVHLTRRERSKIYFASPLFTEMEKMWNEVTVSKIEDYFGIHDKKLDIYLPQRNMEINDKNSYADSIMIADGDNAQLLESGLMIAVLDGQTIDPGVASEIGVAYANKIPIIGVYTDSRTQGFSNIEKINALSTIGENQFHYANLYTIGLIKKNGVLVGSTNELIRQIEKFQKGGSFK